MPRHIACPHCHRPCPRPAAAHRPVRCPHCETSFAPPATAPGAGRRQRPLSPGEDREARFLWYWRVSVVATFVLLLAGTLVYLAVRLGRPEPRITRENFGRLAVGMKESDVVRLLGPPTSVDDSLVPKKGTGTPGWKDAVGPEAVPRRFYWEDGDNVIWALIRMERVQKLGATFDGEQFGEDPRKGQPYTPGAEDDTGGD